MGFAYSPVNKRQYKHVSKSNTKGALPTIHRITGGNASTNDIYLIPFVAETRYKHGNPNISKRVGWTFDFGDINRGDIFILDKQWEPKTMAFFATCLWDAPNYIGEPLSDNGWNKGRFSPGSGDFYTHEDAIELGYFHNREFSPEPSQFYCADFSKIDLKNFTKRTAKGAYEMDAATFMTNYRELLCDKPLSGCCSVNTPSISYTIKRPQQFKRKDADQITDFRPQTDTLRFDTSSFGMTRLASFTAGHNKRVVRKQLAKQDVDFLYDRKQGVLYFNENGAEKGFGDGGIIAILKGAPNLGMDHLDLT